MKIFVNEKILDEGKAVVSVFDRGFLYGDGVFETMRSYNKKVFMLDEHIERLYNAADTIGIKTEKDRKYLKFMIHKLLKLNGLKDAYIRVALTRGEGRVGLDATTAKRHSLVIIAKKFTPYPDKFYKKGVSLYTATMRRNERSVLCGIKSLNYLDNILARMEAQHKGADDALLLNTKGDVAESAVSNIFIVKRKDLITPSLDCGILPGITRKAVLSLAKKAGTRSVEKHIRPKELMGADEVFLTNTLMEIMPVVMIDERIIKNGRPGAITKNIHRLYRTNT